MKKITAFVVIAVLFTAIGIYFGAKRFQPTPPADTAVGALLINFWATWCPPCVSEMPELVALQNDWGSKNLQVVGIGIDSPSNIREFAEKHKITYPLLLGGLEGSELSRQFGNQSGGLPFTILIGPDGSVRQTYMGRLDMEKVRADLASM